MVQFVNRLLLLFTCVIIKGSFTLKHINISILPLARLLLVLCVKLESNIRFNALR